MAAKAHTKTQHCGAGTLQVVSREGTEGDMGEQPVTPHALRGEASVWFLHGSGGILFSLRLSGHPVWSPSALGRNNSKFIVCQERLAGS